MTRRTGRALALAGLVSVALLALAPATLGYNGELPLQVAVTGPSGPLTCPETVTITATVLDGDGQAVPGLAVTWSAQGPGSSVAATTGTTDAQGQASTGAVVGADGAVFTATVEDARGSQVLDCELAGFQLPRTDTQPSPPAVGLAIVLLSSLLVGLRLLPRAIRR